MKFLIILLLSLFGLCQVALGQTVLDSTNTTINSGIQIDGPGNNGNTYTFTIGNLSNKTLKTSDQSQFMEVGFIHCFECVKVISAIDQGMLDSPIQVYPNPARAAVRFQHDSPMRFSYQLTDMRGKSISEGTFTQSAQLSLEGLPAGLYLLQFLKETGQLVQSSKLQVE